MESKTYGIWKCPKCGRENPLLNPLECGWCEAEKKVEIKDMTDAERRMLQEQGLGECWHAVSDYCCSCGDCFNETAHVDYLGRTIDTHLSQNRAFTTPDDWEMVRVKVVVPNVDNYLEYFQDEYEHAWYAFAERMITSSAATLCQDAVDFIKSRPDLFPWVREMEGK